MLEQDAHRRRGEFFARRGWLVVPLLVVGGLLGFRWWWDHRNHLTELGVRPGR